MVDWDVLSDAVGYEVIAPLAEYFASRFYMEDMRYPQYTCEGFKVTFHNLKGAR